MLLTTICYQVSYKDVKSQGSNYVHTHYQYCSNNVLDSHVVLVDMK